MADGSSRRVALTLMAHPDDAEILCAGTLIRLREQHGYEVHIVTATAGDVGSATLSPSDIAAVRRKEAAQAAAMIGATWHCLNGYDLKVVYDESTLAAAIGLFRDVAPTLVFTHPRHDYMVDHEQVHLLARMASFAFAIPHASDRPLREGSRVPHLYYADPIEGLDPYTGQPVDPSQYVDISATIDRKCDMLRCHASQREWLRQHHKMDEYIEAMRRHGASRGRQIGVAYAEGFVQHRGHAYPHDDLLQRLLG